MAKLLFLARFSPTVSLAFKVFASTVTAMPTAVVAMLAAMVVMMLAAAMLFTALLFTCCNEIERALDDGGIGGFLCSHAAIEVVFLRLLVPVAGVSSMLYLVEGLQGKGRPIVFWCILTTRIDGEA